MSTEAEAKPPVWTERNSRQLAERGYTNAGRIFTSGELVIIAREYDRLVTPEAQVLGNEAEGHFPYRAMLNFRSAELKGFIQHPALLAVACRVLGNDVRFWWDQGINKSPGAGSFIAWHQDNGYEPGLMPEYLTCWLALDDSSRENGGLEVIPGSHTSGTRTHEMRGAHAVIVDAELDELDARGAVALDAKAGELLVFSSLLVHQTVGNLTADQQRRSWVIQYCRGDQANQVTGQVYDNRSWVVREGEPVDEPWAERPFDLRADRP
jgi:phytanoyl-CoA hydroxylase